MNKPTQQLTKKKVARRPKTTHELAHSYATRRQTHNASKDWSESEKGTYWWGAYEGYMAGVRYGRRVK